VRVELAHAWSCRWAATLRTKRLTVKPEGVERYLFTILEPQAAGAVRAAEVADGVGVMRILRAERHDLRPPDIRSLDGARDASALRAYEVAANIAFAREYGAIRQSVSPTDLNPANQHAPDLTPGAPLLAQGIVWPVIRRNDELAAPGPSRTPTSDVGRGDIGDGLRLPVQAAWEIASACLIPDGEAGRRQATVPGRRTGLPYS
jgi:hypothetical protein